MKQKVLFVNGHLNTGGVEKSLVDILKHMDYSKYDVHLLLLEEMGDFIKEIPSQVQIRLVSLVNTYGRTLDCLRKCLREQDWKSAKLKLVFQGMRVFGQSFLRNGRDCFYGQEHFDCVIGFRPGICSQLAVYAVNADKRILWWHHGEINDDVADYSELCERADQVIAVSEGCKRMLEEAGINEKKLSCIPNMVVQDDIICKSRQFHPYGKSDRKIIVSVGRLEKEKHFENAILVASKLVKECAVPFEWHIIGDGSLREKLEQQIQQLNLADVVFLEGNQVNPYPFIADADVYVHPSYVESQGLSILEALTLNIPCIVTKSIGPTEFITDGENGLLVEKDADLLYESVYAMLHNEEMFRKLKNKSKCPSQYNTEVVIQRIDSILN